MARTTLFACVLLVCVAAPASAQQILYNTNSGFRTGPIVGALRDLDLPFQAEDRDDELADRVRSRRWDLVIVRLRDPYAAPYRADILAALQEHVDRGGALMFSIAQLDEMPDFWPLLGIEGARDLELPLSDIRSPYPTRHPSVEHGGINVNDELFGPDYGDTLIPTDESFTLDVYVDSGTAAITMAREGRVIANGQEWDNWDVANGIDLAKDQIEWLLGCPADLDGDSDLTVFDFIEFQNRFDSSGTTGFADFDYNGRLDVFDFLEFFNLFDAGC